MSFGGTFEWLWESLKNILKEISVWLVNLLIESIAGLIGTAADLLPTWVPLDPGSIIDDYGIITTINWIFPVDYAVLCVQAILFSTIAYYTVGVVTRWGRVHG